MFSSKLYYGNSSSRAPSMRSYVTVYGVRAWCAQMPPSKLLTCAVLFNLFFYFTAKYNFYKIKHITISGINIIINISTVSVIHKQVFDTNIEYYLKA